MKFEIGQKVVVHGNGNTVETVTNIDRESKQVAVDGWWEPMDKCKIVPPKSRRKIYATYHFGGEFSELVEGE